MADVNANLARFKEAQARAKKLIQMDANGSLDKYGKDAINEYRNGYGEDGLTSQSIIPENVHNTQRDYSQMPITDSKLANSKLPSEILESFKKKQINTDALGGGFDTQGGSVLDLLGGNQPQKQMVQEQVKQPRQVVKEQTTVTQTIPSNVDYSLIKTIVEDCMKKYASALKKSIINENKNMVSEGASLKAMKIGSKFSFIDSKGNLYEATLKKVKNLND